MVSIKYLVITIKVYILAENVTLELRMCRYLVVTIKVYIHFS
jgi:hypothetical protein